MKRFLFALLVLLPLSAYAEVVTAPVLIRYDLDSTSAIGCVLLGSSGRPLASPINVSIPIKTTGASANVTAVTATTYPFTDLAVGDIILVANTDRMIITKTDADNIVVDTAVTIPGNTFSYYRPSCDAAGGWFPVSDYSSIAITWQLDQYNVTGGIDMRLECRGGYYGAQPVQVWPACTTGACGTYQNYAGTAGIASRNRISTDIDVGVKECRVLMLIHTSDDGGDLTTNREFIYVGFDGSTR